MDSKLILSNQVEIYDKEVTLSDEQELTESYALIRFKSRVLTISPLMRTILEEIKNPNTIKEVVVKMSQEWQCSVDSIEQPISAFLNKMQKLGCIIPFDSSHSEKNNLKAEQLDEKTIFFDKYRLINPITINYRVALYKSSLIENEQHVYTLKILLESKAKEVFLKEFDILTSIPAHPYIRSVYNCGLYNGNHYIVLEYIEGEPLTKKLDKITLLEKYRLSSQIMQSIMHLHEHEVLHGDIHLGNFLIDEEENCQLIDLGMSYRSYEKEIKHGGIPRYMPPERMPDHNLVFSASPGNYVSEVFQLGICLYYILSGSFPFKGTLLKELSQSIKNDDFLPLNRTVLGEKIPEGVANVVYKSLEKKPENRYQQIRDMLKEWQQITHNISDHYQ